MTKDLSNEKYNLNNRFIEFTLNVIKTNKKLKQDTENIIFFKQIIRSSSSIGANYKESQVSQSKKDFITKAYISLKEANETYYWLELIQKYNSIDLKYLLNECEEIIKILYSIIKTSKSRK